MTGERPDIRAVEAERERLRHALEASEARFRSIIERNADGVLVIDHAGIIRYVNPAAERLMCRPSAELAGALFGIPIIPGDTTELDMPCHDDGTLVVEMRVVETEWEGCPAHLASLRDITERKRTEEAIRTAEERSRRISEATSDFTCSLQVIGNGQVVLEWLTDAFRRVTGYTAAEVQAMGWENLIHPEDRDIAVQHAVRILAGQADSCELRIVTGSGEVRWLRVSTRAVSDPVDESIVRIYGAGQDITDRRRLEDELRHRIEELAEMDRRKDEFLAMLAHELRNPLAPIRNAVQVLRRIGDRATADHMREIIGSQVDHLARLIDDLLDVTRITRGMIQLRTEPTDLLDALTGAMDPLRPLFEQHQLGLVVTTRPGPMMLQADPTRLQQVISNLLGNALKYTDPGGRVEVEVDREAHHFVLRVRDNGIGISPEMLPRIFDPFSQADGSLDRTRGGLGIGLTLARTLVQMHGGELTATSPGLGRGSEFVLRLPAPAANLSGTAGGRCIPGPDAGDESADVRPPVLVVDDNIDAARSLSVLLRIWGHTAHVVHDGPEALEAAQRLRPRVVLLDIGLPKLDGYQVARALRAQPEFAETKIVAMTGYGQDEDRRKSREAGFDIHLVKPVDLDELESILTRATLPG